MPQGKNPAIALADTDPALVIEGLSRVDWLDADCEAKPVCLRR